MPDKEHREVEKVVRVAMCQIVCLDGDRAGNFVRIENALSEAKDADADIACFPEAAVLGWLNPEAHRRGYGIPGVDSDRICELARNYGIHICVGLTEKDGTDLYDTAILADDRGKILLKHRKLNILKELMSPAYVPGSTIHVAKTKLGRIGVMVCADTFLRDILKRMRDMTPDMVLVPYGWAATPYMWPHHGQKLSEIAGKTAKTIYAPVIGVDLIGMISNGPWKGKVYGGQSVAFDREGNLLAEAKDRDRDIAIVDIPIQD